RGGRDRPRPRPRRRAGPRTRAPAGPRRPPHRRPLPGGRPMTTTAPDPTLSPDPRLPVAAVLSRQLRSTLIAWWSSIVVLFAAGLVVRAWIAEVDSSTWQYAQVAPAVFMLVVGILLPTVFLPM